MAVSPAEIVQQFLIGQGILVGPTLTPALTTDWPSVIGPVPDQDGAPNNYVGLIDTGADQRGRPMRGAPGRNEYPTTQVLIRSDVYPNGWAQGLAIQDKLDKVGLDPAEGGLGPVGVTYNGVDYVLRRILVTTSLAKIGQEQHNLRQVFVINAQIHWDVADNSVGGSYFGPYF